MELSPHVSSVRERVHFESSLEQKSFKRVRGATNPATRRNPVDYHASRVLNGTGEIESGTQAPQLRIGRWKQACCCSTGNCQCALHLYAMGDSFRVPTMPRR